MSDLSSFRDLEFPLNVYAGAQYLEYGKVKYLHYGLFTDDETSLEQAQQHSTDLILARLPSPPCRILEVGIGVGTTCRELTRRGYQVTGITPNGAQLALARAGNGADTYLIQTRFEDVYAPEAPYHVILFQESAQYIDPLELFSRCYKLLAEDGLVLMLDQVALQYTEPHKENPHLLGNLQSIGERCGFELRERLDLSMQAASTLDHILRLVQNHRAPIQAGLGLKEHQLDSLRAANRAVQKKYISGLYGYALLRFTKKTNRRWRVTPAERDEQSALRALFKTVFADDMSAEFWQWKYGEGRGQGVIGWRDDKIVAHYGGITKPILYLGEPQLACQICDVMVHPSERAVLTKQGPFFLTAASALEAWLGYGARHLLGFGFPDKRVMGLAEKLGLYGEVGRMKAVHWTHLPRITKPRAHFRKLQSARDQELVDRLWLQMASDLRDGIVGVRDWSYIQHRYLSHPHKQYDVLLISDLSGHEQVGVVVLRKDGDNCELLDVIGPLNNIAQLVRHVLQLAGDWGMQELFCWIPEYHAHRFVTDGAEIRELDVSIPANIWTNGPDVEQLHNRWWLMSGDTDFH